MTESRALIYSDEPSTGRTWALLLSELQCTPIAVNSVLLAVEGIRSSAPDIIIVDVASRSVNAIEICVSLRQRSSRPILLLTSIDDESHTLEAYRAGIDECIIKPISPAIFVAKAYVWLRRAGSQDSPAPARLAVGDVMLELATHELVSVDGRRIRLSKQEFQLLYLLMAHPNQAMANEEIIQQIWGLRGETYSSLVKNLVYRLRHKVTSNLGSDWEIVSVPDGYMYRGDEPPEQKV